MLTPERLCTHIIQLLHAPIRVYDAAGNRTAIYVDHNEQQDVLACDGEYLAWLLEKGRREAPVLHLEAEEMLYGAVRGAESVYLIGPCCLGRDPVTAARRLVRRHGMDPRKPYGSAASA